MREATLAYTVDDLGSLGLSRLQRVFQRPRDDCVQVQALTEGDALVQHLLDKEQAEAARGDRRSRVGWLLCPVVAACDANCQPAPAIPRCAAAVAATIATAILPLAATPLVLVVLCDVTRQRRIAACGRARQVGREQLPHACDSASGCNGTQTRTTHLQRC